jgi:hypothetical protein
MCVSVYSGLELFFVTKHIVYPYKYVYIDIASHVYLSSGSVACLGQGTCTDAGFCECDPIWRGLSCQLECPLLAGVPCAGKSEKRDR